MCRVSLDIVALALYTSYGGVVYEPRRIRISRCVFKYCCGVEFPSILRKFAPLYLLSPRYSSGGSREGARGGGGEGGGPHPFFWTKLRPEEPKNFFERPPPPPYLRLCMTGPLLPLISRSGSGIVYWLKATHCWGNHSSCAPLPTFTFIYLCELTTILVNFSWET